MTAGYSLKKYQQTKKTKTTYVWYCACKKLNSSFILSSVSAIVNLIGPCWGGPWNHKKKEKKIKAKKKKNKLISAVIFQENNF